MNPAAEIPVIINVAAGRAERNATVARIIELFRANGLQPRIVLVQKEIARAARRALEHGSKLVVAAGGDGTISGVASALVGTGAILGVLPLGTLNHFARDLGIPTELEAAVRVIAGGKIANVDAGEVNGRIFINNSSVGLYPNIVREREQERRAGRSKWIAFVRATFRVLQRLPRVEVQLVAGGKRIVHTTVFVFIGNNEYQTQGLQIGTRRALNRGELYCYTAPVTTRAQLFRLTVLALLGRLREAPDFEVIHGKELRVGSHRKHLHVARDGEVKVLHTPLDYQIRPEALRVLVP
jgi:YegS/Rv2252/BmrU family lipid kinase